MKLADAILCRNIAIVAGGPGSGCHGDNCGRPRSTGSELISLAKRVHQIHNSPVSVPFVPFTNLRALAQALVEHGHTPESYRVALNKATKENSELNNDPELRDSKLGSKTEAQLATQHYEKGQRIDDYDTAARNAGRDDLAEEHAKQHAEVDKQWREREAKEPTLSQLTKRFWDRKLNSDRPTVDVYHVTTTAAANSIKENGFRPGKDTGTVSFLSTMPSKADAEEWSAIKLATNNLKDAAVVHFAVPKDVFRAMVNHPETSAYSGELVHNGALDQKYFKSIKKLT